MEPHTSWKNASGWIDKTLEEITVTDSSPASTFKLIGTGAGAANTILVLAGGEAIPFLTAVALVANVSGTIIGSPPVEKTLNKTREDKIWPDPAYANGVSWESYFEPNVPSQVPINDCKNG